MNKSGLLAMQMTERNFNQNNSFDSNTFNMAGAKVNLPSYPMKEILQFLDGKTNELPDVNSVSSFALKNFIKGFEFWSLYGGADLNGISKIRITFSFPRYSSVVQKYVDYHYDLNVENLKKVYEFSKYDERRVEYLMNYLKVVETAIKRKKAMINETLSKDINISEKDMEITSVTIQSNDVVLVDESNSLDELSGKKR